MIQILPPPLGPGYDVFIYPGQSNTVGFGEGPFTDTDPSNDGAIFQVGRGADDMQIIPMASPLSFWVPKSRSYGISLARYYAANLLEPGRKIVIVPTALGDTSVLQWLGEASAPHPLYPDMAARINLCLGLPGGTNRIVGWFEHQGEEDILIAQNPSDPLHAQMPDADTYYAKKCQYIAKVRDDFGEFPMQFGLYSQSWNNGDGVKQEFENALTAVAKLHPYCRTISTLEVPDNNSLIPPQGAIHFTAEGQEMLAARHYNALVELLGGA